MVDGEYNYLPRNKPLRSCESELIISRKHVTFSGKSQTMKLLKLMWLYMEVHMIKITIVQRNRMRKHIADVLLLNYVIPIQSTDRDTFYILFYSNIEYIHVPCIDRTGYGPNIYIYKKKKTL